MESWRTTKCWNASRRICTMLCCGLLAFQFHQHMIKAADTASNSRGQKYSITEIRAKLREQLTSIQSVWCEYKVQSTSDRDKPDTWPTLVWAQRNKRMLHKTLPHQPKGASGVWLEQFESFDGQTGFQVLFGADVKSHQKLVHRWNTPPPRLPDLLVPAHHLGLFVNNSSSTLLGLIARTDIAIQPDIQINGHATVLVELGTYDFQGTNSNVLRAFLDPEFDFLPRQIESLPLRLLREQSKSGAERTFEGRPGDAFWQIGVDSFFEVEDSSAGRKRWFPRRLITSGQVTAIVEKVRINDEVPVSSFQPILADGVTIIDNPGTPQMRESTYKTTTRPLAAESTAFRVDKATDANSDPNIEAISPRRISIVNVLILITFLLISVACIVARRRT